MIPLVCVVQPVAQSSDYAEQYTEFHSPLARFSLHPGRCHASASSVPTALSSDALQPPLSIHLGSKSCKVNPLVPQGCSPCKMYPKPPFYKQITWLNCPWVGSHICFRTVFSQIKGGRNSSVQEKEGKKREKEKKTLCSWNQPVASA